MKILTFASDLSGCHNYRVRIPNIELKRFGVENTTLTFIPNQPGVGQIQTLVDLIENYDLVILQRCHIPEIYALIREATSFLGIPLIFETDDDYFNLEKDNPAYWSMVPRGILKDNMSTQEMEQIRNSYLEAYKQVISGVDMITTSTEELKHILYPYNRNIEVLPNNVLDVYRYRTYDPEQNFIGPDGKFYLPNNLGMISTPSYAIKEDGTLLATPRIGYSCTPSHWGQDWKTVEYYWHKLIQKHSKTCWFVYVGAQPGPRGDWSEDYWIKQHHEVVKRFQVKNRAIPIAPAEYDLYNFHLRNIDIGIAPLSPNIFNMSKSEIKWLEYSSWGIPSVLPNYITYNRSVENHKTALLYDNGREFQEAIESLIHDSKLRHQIGLNALNWVEQNRLEKHWAKRRFDIYKDLVDNSYRLKIFEPEVKNEAIVP
jgi:glycosyltransferase involved in cell wall biosynthesis